ncbi:hypothetical protein B0A50_02029 [Salinomyces thailandicus]|uniref:40S ribosomal protein S3 n=1 Tax=Salinomyces thailandicus TaxID=706561 RepID=A0A4U0U752_9PEZI|nr:hypothetical protein B0A50_02029 [Salinomyces thailandica]
MELCRFSQSNRKSKTSSSAETAFQAAKQAFLDAGIQLVEADSASSFLDHASDGYAELLEQAMIQSAPKSKIERWFEDVAMQSPDSPAFDDVDAENWKDVNEHVGLAGSASVGLSIHYSHPPKMQKAEAPAQAMSGANISKRRKFVADGVFYAELNEFFQRELAEEGYSGVEVRVTPTVTDIIIRATHTQEVLGEQGRRIRELTSLITHRFRFPPDSVSLYAAKVQSRGLSAVAQCESLRYKLLNGLAVRRACYGVLRFIMESGAKGCEVVVSGKLRAARAKSMKFTDGFMIHSGQPAKDFIDHATRHVLLRQGVLGIKVKIMRASSSPSDPTGEKAGGKGLPDSVTIIEPKEEQPILAPNSQDYGAKAAQAQAAQEQQRAEAEDQGAAAEDGAPAGGAPEY